MASDFAVRRVIGVDPGSYMHALVATRKEIEHWRMKGVDALCDMAGASRASEVFGPEGVKKQETKPGYEEAVAKKVPKNSDAAVLAAEEAGNFRLVGERLPKHSVGILVCDINDALEHAVQIFEYFVEQELYECPCLVVLTFKNTCRSKTEFAERKQQALMKISAVVCASERSAESANEPCGTLVSSCKSELHNTGSTSAVPEVLEARKNAPRLSHVREIHLFANTRLETTIVGQLL